MKIKPLRARLQELIRLGNLRAGIIEQDYLLSWTLIGIYQHELLKSSMVFKGGTALKKCYFGNYRFSEDIDFTAISGAPSGSILLKALTEACQNAETLMNEYAPIKIEIRRYEEKYPHPHGQEAFSVYAQYPWQRQPLTKIMIEISRDEALLLNPQNKPLIHAYDESIDQEIMVYSLEEIILEKLRAILQHTKKLHERDFDRSRARDYYDLWNILRKFEDKLNLQLVQTLLPFKCSKKGVEFKEVEDFFDEKMIGNVRRTWEKWLGPLVVDLPECELVLSELRSKLELVVRFTNPNQVLGELIQNSRLNSRELNQICERVILAGADVNQTIKGLSPFQLAVLKENKSLADFILLHGGEKISPPGLGYVSHYNLYKE